MSCKSVRKNVPFVLHVDKACKSLMKRQHLFIFAKIVADIFVENFHYLNFFAKILILRGKFRGN
jgi:hypothetical protein